MTTKPETSPLPEPETRAKDTASDDFGSNCMRLGARGWRVVVFVLLVVCLAGPVAHEALAPLSLAPEWRLPHAASRDYWLVERVAQSVARDETIAVIGDSVVWGEYTAPEEAFPVALAAASGRSMRNLGVAGLHPVALEGLLRHHGASLAKARAIVWLDLLWLSSPTRDLSSDEPVEFNHRGLVPQFDPTFAAYAADASERIGHWLDRRITVRGWVQHLRIQLFDGQDLSTWTVSHPTESALERFRARNLEPATEPRHTAVSWRERGIRTQHFEWVPLARSRQWRALRAAVDGLRDRGTSVLVVVGPLNEHLMDDASRAAWLELRARAVEEVGRGGLAVVAPSSLPSELWADASHPLSAGYRRLAAEIASDPVFLRWLGATGSE